MSRPFTPVLSAIATPGQPVPHAGTVWRDGAGSLPFRAAQAVSRFVFTTFFDIKVWGAETFPRTGGMLVVSNHQSMLDPVLLGFAIPRPLSYMAKSELFSVHKIFTWLIESLGAFPVRQGGSAAGAIKETIDRLQEGRALNIFPEGARTRDGEPLPFQNGIALVVRKAKVPVVPVAIAGSFESYPIGTKIPLAQPIRIMYGPPLFLHDLKPAEITARLQAEVRGLYAKLQATDPLADSRRLWANDRARRERAGKSVEKKVKGAARKAKVAAATGMTVAAAL